MKYINYYYIKKILYDTKSYIMTRDKYINILKFSNVLF